MLDVQSQPDIMFDEVVLSKIHHPLGIVSNTIFSKTNKNDQSTKTKKKHDNLIQSGQIIYSDLTLPGPPNSGLVREIPENFKET